MTIASRNTVNNEGGLALSGGSVACITAACAQGSGDGMPRGRGGFRGRGEFARGRGDFGRFGGRQGWEGRGRRGSYEERPQLPEIDPALLERRRASNAALLKRQVSQLQVRLSSRPSSRDMQTWI